eukprot:Opistho-2@55633
MSIELRLIGSSAPVFSTNVDNSAMDSGELSIEVHDDGRGVGSVVMSTDPSTATSSGQQPTAMDVSRSILVEYATLREDPASIRAVSRTGLTPLPTDDHLLTVGGLMKRHRTNVGLGLSNDEAARRLATDGPNSIRAPPTDKLRKVAGYLFGGFCWLLWIASIITFLAWKPLGQPPAIANLALAIVLLIVIFLQVAFTAYQDWTSSRVMGSINSMLPQFATVLRGGRTAKVPISNVVVGDIVLVKYGNKIPADLRLVDVHGLRVDNSILTGESVPTNCTVEATNNDMHETRNIALMGTYITEGEATGVAIATGERTIMGKVALLASRAKPKSTILQKEIQHFVHIIAALALCTGTICMIVWGAWLRSSFPDFLNLSNMLSTVMGVIVAYVPEGLPIAVTLVLTIIARRMFRQKVLVKNLTTIETLGCVNVLCSDKTGTLTTNQMVVGSAAVGDTAINIDHGPMDKRAEMIGFRELSVVAHLCNGASFDVEDAGLPISARRAVGDATDVAMLRFAGSIVDMDQNNRLYDRVHHVPFNSHRKYMATIVRPVSENCEHFSGAKTDDLVLLMKGAPDILLRACTHYMAADKSGSVLHLTPEQKEVVMGYQETWGKLGQRVLLVARRTLHKGELPVNTATDDFQVTPLVKDLCIVGLTGIADPARPETASVVKTIRGAGVRVFMVTGDFPATAAAIARKVGIFTREFVHRVREVTESSKGEVAHASLLLTGADIANLTDADWDTIANYNEIVFARTTPEQKFKIVKAFQAHGCVVAVTGGRVFVFFAEIAFVIHTNLRYCREHRAS